VLQGWWRCARKKKEQQQGCLGVGMHVGWQWGRRWDCWPCARMWVLQDCHGKRRQIVQEVLRLLLPRLHLILLSPLLLAPARLLLLLLLCLRSVAALQCMHVPYQRVQRQSDWWGWGAHFRGLPALRLRRA